MDEKAKMDKRLASISKGKDKKNDALMLMSPENNWDQFLTPAPFAIALLGELILISAGTDFSLEEKPPKDGFKHLQHPNSFRASLVQISNAGWFAFNEAHNSMYEISLHSGNVDDHVKNAVKFLLQGTSREVEEVLPMSFSKIEDIANKSLHLAQGVEKRFIGVMELTGELLEVSTSSKGVYDKISRQTEIAIKVAKTERERKEKEVKEAERILKIREHEVEDAQSEFKTAMDNIPTGSTLLMLVAGDVLVEAIRCYTSSQSLMKDTVASSLLKVFQMEDSSEIDEAYNDEKISLHPVYSQVPLITKYIDNIIEILTKETDDHGNPYPDMKAVEKGDLDFFRTSLETRRKNINKEDESGELRNRVLKVCNEGISICNIFKDIVKHLNVPNLQTRVSNAVARAQKLQGKAKMLQAEACIAHSNNPLDNKSPHLSKTPTESSRPSAVKSASENARYKTEIAKEMLKDAKRRQEKSASELKESNEKLTEVLIEIAKLDLKSIDFNTIRDTLVKGIWALAKVREQWGKLVRFFEMLSSLIKSCLCTSLVNFVDHMKVGRVLQMKDYTIPLSNIFRDVMIEQASKASQIAYVVHIISGTYVQISNEHLMDKITGLGRLVALDPKKDEHEILLRRRELHNGCFAAQKSIQSIVLKQKAEFNQNIEERIRKISEIESEFPAIEQSRIEEIKKNVSSGIANFSKEEVDDEI